MGTQRAELTRSLSLPLWCSQDLPVSWQFGMQSHQSTPPPPAAQPPVLGYVGRIGPTGCACLSVDVTHHGGGTARIEAPSTSIGAVFRCWHVATYQPPGGEVSA